ncbi:hypothetical protein EVAR_80761_1 [Eumeta japonica]|uniref:Uncharacterized protein n=1 Tax=Eumeta variegata TaxID=151549 RepID=A0A4C1XAM5_EUMVA|nr:hypothetical protein EVAR_80761_1 [Eumeta japonica]
MHNRDARKFHELRVCGYSVARACFNFGASADNDIAGSCRRDASRVGAGRPDGSARARQRISDGSSVVNNIALEPEYAGFDPHHGRSAN